MIREHFFMLAVLLLFAPPSFSIARPHIADVNILLPPMLTNPVEYRLQGSDGCFQWSWDHHEVLYVLPEYNLTTNCSTSARLRSIGHYVGRMETTVYATDIHSGVIVQCRVFIDNIHSIKVFHNSIKLDVDGLATLRVRAFDSEDNVFSSIVGLQFMWQMMPLGQRQPHFLVHVPLEDSPLSDCGGLCGDLDIQKRLEDEGVYSDLYVVKGIGIGNEVVSVHVLEPGFEHMGDKITLRVVEAISIDPQSPIFVLIGAVFSYKIKINHQAVDLPSPNYIWYSLNSTVAEVESTTGIVNALNLGETIVTVEDARVSGHMQISSLHVVVPDYIYLYILPLSLSGYVEDDINPIPSGSLWYIISHRPYVIHVKAYTEKCGLQGIYISQNDDVNLQCLGVGENWDSNWVEYNVAEEKSRVLTANLPGLGTLKASLSYSSEHDSGKKVLNVVQDFMACEPVSLGKESSQNILLPWAPGVYQKVELIATGGCAEVATDYKWFSSDTSIISVSDGGILHAKQLGKVTVRIVSMFDSLNYDEVLIEVCNPSMVMVQSLSVETVLGSYLLASVTMKASDDAYFFKCDELDSLINWSVESRVFRIVNKTEEPFCYEAYKTIELNKQVSGPPCGWTCLLASVPGRTSLHATLSNEHPLMNASFDIAAFAPLQVYQAGDGNSFGGYRVDLVHENLVDLYLAPGCTMDLYLVGGPERWAVDSEYLESLDVLDEQGSYPRDYADIAHLVTGNASLYSIFCEACGTSELVFKRGNLVGPGHPLPSIEERHLQIFCSFPSMVALIIDKPANTPEVIRSAIESSHGLDARVTSIIVDDGRSIRVAAVGLTDSSRIFANSSSLCPTWDLSNCDGIAYWEYDNEKSKCSWERFLILQSKTGQCMMHVSVTSFSDASSYRVSDSVRIQFVFVPTLLPEDSLLFFSPHAKMNLSVFGGSRSFDVANNDSRVIEIVETSSTLDCLQLTLMPKGVGSALITVYDIGITPSLAVSSVIRVADIDWIKILSPEVLSLMLGGIQSIKLLVGVKDGRVFDSSQFVYMNLSVHIEDPVVRLLDTNNVDKTEFVILAKHLGSTNIFVSVRQRLGHEVFSESIMVEVYEPPSIHPSSLFLAPGASYVLTVEGGPKNVLYIEFASIDETIAAIDISSGRISATSPGNTTIIASIHGPSDSVLCQIHSKVKVGIPSFVTLTTPSTQLAAGREMFIYPSFVEGNLFSFYELCNHYDWTIQDQGIMRFQEVAKSHNGSDRDNIEDLGFIRALYGRSAGTTTVGLSFSCEFASSGLFLQSRSYSTSISLHVLPGVKEIWILPPHYISSNILHGSSELTMKLDAQNCDESLSYSLLRDCDKAVGGLAIVGDRIKTEDHDNVACVVAQYNTCGIIEIASCIRVSEVVQIRITSMDYPVRAIPLRVGAELELQVGYYDGLGNPFLEALNVIDVRAETNFPDIVFIKSSRCSFGSIHIKGMKHGKALLRVYDRIGSLKSDYMLVNVFESKSFSDELAFSVPASGLKEEVHVHYDTKLSTSGFNNAMLIAALCSVSLLLLTTIVFFFLLDWAGRCRSRAGTPLISNTTATSDGRVTDEQSPRTPPTFVNYVRRTMDETPYKREHRLRFST